MMTDTFSGDRRETRRGDKMTRYIFRRPQGDAERVYDVKIHSPATAGSHEEGSDDRYILRHPQGDAMRGYDDQIHSPTTAR